MKSEGLFLKLYYLLDLFMKIAYVNLLWILFSLLGFIVLGVVPSSVALLTVVRKWIMEDVDIPLFKTFSSAYRKEFLKSNLFGLIFLIVYLILSVNFQYMMQVDGILQVVVGVALVINAILFFVTLVYFFPVYIHYQLRFIEYLKHSFLMGMINLHFVLLICVSLYVIYHLFIYIPAFIGGFLPIIVGMILMPITLFTFKKFDKKKEEE